MTFEDLVYCAKICDQIENFPLMMNYVKEIINRGQPLGLEERNLVSVAFKNTIGPLRTTWRLVESVMRRDKGKHSQVTREGQLEYASKIRTMAEEDIERSCLEILKIIET